MSTQIETISDNQTGAKAKILPQLGFNCFSFVVPSRDEEIEVLWSEPGFSESGASPTRSGIPLLFPYAGRIFGKSFSFENKEYSLSGELDDGRGNAIHGFVLNRPWRVVDRQSHRVAGQFQASLDAPQLLKLWPCDFRITASYEIATGSLTLSLNVENPAPGCLPFWLGAHPYLRLPLGRGGRPENCVVRVPVDQFWELERLEPTGKRFPTEGNIDLSRGMPVEDHELDAVFTDIGFVDGRAEATIADPDNFREIRTTFDDTFRHCVVYIPPHREAICIEPYTAVPNAFHLEARGVETGLVRLFEGQAIHAKIEWQFNQMTH